MVFGQVVVNRATVDRIDVLFFVERKRNTSHDASDQLVEANPIIHQGPNVVCGDDTRTRGI